MSRLRHTLKSMEISQEGTGILGFLAGVWSKGVSPFPKKCIRVEGVGRITLAVG
jgi:hypothetical protein